MFAALATSAAVRLPRTAAARRALLVALFLGGLLGLAFLFGGAAHAAESNGSASAEQLLDSGGEAGPQTEKPLVKPSEDTAAASAERTGAVRDTVERTVRPVVARTEQLTRPVGDLVENVTEAADLPVRLPGHEAGAQRPGSGKDRAGERTSGHERGGKAAADAVDRTSDRIAAAFSSRSDRGSVRAEQARQDGTNDDRDGFPARFPQAPAAPSGSASQNAHDGSGPRGGDTHATVATDAPRFGLLAGAIRAASDAPTHERSSEILEFPG